MKAPPSNIKGESTFAHTGAWLSSHGDMCWVGTPQHNYPHQGWSMVYAAHFPIQKQEGSRVAFVYLSKAAHA